MPDEGKNYDVDALDGLENALHLVHMNDPVEHEHVFEQNELEEPELYYLTQSDLVPLPDAEIPLHVDHEEVVLAEPPDQEAFEENIEVPGSGPAPEATAKEVIPPVDENLVEVYLPEHPPFPFKSLVSTE